MTYLCIQELQNVRMYKFITILNTNLKKYNKILQYQIYILIYDCIERV